MTRDKSASDYEITIDGIGTFMFARRNMRDQFRIQAEYARLTEGVSPIPVDLDIAAQAVSCLNVLTVSAPETWDISAMDPLEEESYAKILQVYGAVRAREESFRRGDKKDGAPAGQGKVVDS